MTADETHHMTLEEIFAARMASTRSEAEAIGRAAIVESTARGVEQVVVVNADPVALAIERRKRDR